MEEPTGEELEVEYLIEEEWEFDAPRYYDFSATDADDKLADRWFDLKLYDDVSPIFDEDEFDMEYDFGTSAPDSPANNRLPSSIHSTPMTPSMRSRIEERSPQREDDLLGRIAEKLMPTHTSPLPLTTAPASPSPVNSPSRVYMKKPPQVPEDTTTSDILEIAALALETLAPPPQPAAPKTMPPSKFKVFTAPKQTTAPVVKPKMPLLKPLAANFDKENAVQKPTQVRMPVPPTTLGTMTTKAGKLDKERAKPLQPVSANRLNQVKGTGLAALAQPKKKAVVYSKTTTQRSPKVLVKKQPFASQRSVVAPIRTNANQAIAQGSAFNAAPAASRVSKMPVQTKSTASRPIETSVKQPLQTRYELVKRPLTVAVTPELMKRRNARLKESGRLTTEQLRALEAEKKRREFFQELHRKNANRGTAPRVTYDHAVSTSSTRPAAKVGHWR